MPKAQKSPRGDYVEVYDIDTGTVSKVLRSDLAKSGEPMVPMSIEGKGLYWVSARKLAEEARNRPRLHSFDDDFRRIFRFLYEVLHEVYLIPLEEWEERFSRERDPEREIMLWVIIANVYRELVSGRSLSLSKKKDYFGVNLARSFVVIDPKATAKETSLSKAEATEVNSTWVRVASSKNSPNDELRTDESEM